MPDRSTAVDGEPETSRVPRAKAVDRIQNLALLGTHSVGRQTRRRHHDHKGKQPQQRVGNHVAQRPGIRCTGLDMLRAGLVSPRAESTYIGFDLEDQSWRMSHE
jgi:hypothetical protein